MGMIIHEAGGAISNGGLIFAIFSRKRIDDSTPIYVGGKKEIGLIEKFMSEG